MVSGWLLCGCFGGLGGFVFLGCVAFFFWQSVLHLVERPIRTAYCAYCSKEAPAKKTIKTPCRLGLTVCPAGRPIKRTPWQGACGVERIRLRREPQQIAVATLRGQRFHLPECGHSMGPRFVSRRHAEIPSANDFKKFLQRHQSFQRRALIQIQP